MPVRQEVHIDRALSDFSLGILQEPSNYVAGSVFPIVEVDKLSDRYYILERNPFAGVTPSRAAPIRNPQALTSRSRATTTTARSTPYTPTSMPSFCAMPTTRA